MHQLRELAVNQPCGQLEFHFHSVMHDLRRAANVQPAAQTTREYTS